MPTHDGGVNEKEDSAATVNVYVPPRDVIEPAFAANNIPVFLGCDDNFLPHAATVVASLMRHASPVNNYDILIVQTGVSEERIAAFSDWMRRFPNASLRFVEVGGLIRDVGEGYFPTTREYPVAVFFRMFAPSIFVHYDKMAYLDSDIVVLDDIAGFYNTDLEGHPLAACHDFVTERQSLVDPAIAAYRRENLNKQPGEDSFMSGGLVMDLRLMRELDLQRAMLEKMRELDNPSLPDQEVMNAVLGTNVKYLGLEWNLLDWMADPEEESPGFQLLSAEALSHIRETRGKNKVLHFPEKKPWTLDYAGKFDHVYWEYAAETPFYGETLARLDAECGLSSLAARLALLSLQDAHFAVRGWLAPATDKLKYANRRRNVRARRKTALRHLRRMWNKR